MTATITAPRRGITTVVVAAIVLALSVVAAPAADASTATQNAERDFAALVNTERAKQGLGALQIQSDITTVARTHSARMASDWNLFHNPDYSRQISGWQRLSENVGYGPSVSVVHSALMKSEGHRNNILDDRVTEIGVGVVIKDGRVWVTQNFRRPSSNVIVSSPSTTTHGDVSSTSAHASSITMVSRRSIATDCGLARFCPNESVTRDDFAGMLAKSLGLPAASGSTFGDVSGPNAGYVEALAQAGLTNGCGNGNFCPDVELTREQMATFFAAALELKPASHPFVDVAGTHSGNVGALYKQGIVTGSTSTTFAPRDHVTRAQTASMLARNLG